MIDICLYILNISVDTRIQLHNILFYIFYEIHLSLNNSCIRKYFIDVFLDSLYVTERPFQSLILSIIWHPPVNYSNQIPMVCIS